MPYKIPDEDVLPGEITVLEYAKYRRITPSSVSNRIKTGLLDGAVRQLPNGRYLVDKEKADKIWIARGDPSHLRAKGAAPMPDEDDLNAVLAQTADFTAAKAKEKKYQAEIAEMNFKKLAGELVEKKLVQKTLFEMTRKIRNNLLNIPTKVMDVLAAETDPYQIEKKLNEEIHKTLEDLTDELI